MFRAGPGIVIFVCGGLLLGCTESEIDQQKEVKVILSKAYTIDRIYPSMKGPGEYTKLRLLNTEKRELLWVTGYRAVITSGDGKSPKSQRYMCHSSLRARSNLSGGRPMELTLAQGQQSLQLPDGFGIALMSDASLDLFTQVLNLHQKEGTEQLRQKVTVEFVRDSDLKTPYQPLQLRGAQVMVSLEGRPVTFGVPEGDVSDVRDHASCLPGKDASGTKRTQGTSLYRDSFGRRFSGHFVVPPGRHVYRTLATGVMALEYDTTIHYIAVHVHPFAESVELRDLTEDESVYKSDAKNLQHGIGLEKVDYYSSPNGLPIFHDHEYEIVAVYDNTSNQNQDAMAVMFMYTLDKRFTR